MIAQIPGTVSFSPFGSNTRAIVITVDPDRLRAHNFSPEDVVAALGHRQRRRAVGQFVHPGRDAAGAHQRHGRRSAGDGQHPHSAGQGRLHPRRGHDPGHHRHQLRLRAGQRPQVDLHPRGQEGHGLDATVVRQIHESMPLVPVGGARGRARPLRVRRIADGAGGDQERGHGGGHRRRADGPDDPALPARRAQRDRGAGQHPAGA